MFQDGEVFIGRDLKEGVSVMPKVVQSSIMFVSFSEDTNSTLRLRNAIPE